MLKSINLLYKAQTFFPFDRFKINLVTYYTKRKKSIKTQKKVVQDALVFFSRIRFRLVYAYRYNKHNNNIWI